MEKYKYQLKRTEVDANHAERLQDFDRLLSKTIHHNKIHLLKKVLFYSILVVVAGTGIFMITQKMDDDVHVTESRTPAATESTQADKNQSDQQKEPILLNAEKEKPDSIPEKESAQDPQQEILKENKPVQESNSDLYKIREKPAEKNIFIEAEPTEGFDKLYAYLEKSFVIPENLELNNVSGNVLVSFSISEKGEVEDVEVERSVQPVLDSIAIECVKNMPAWKPATLNGDPISTHHKIPLYFRNLNNE